MKQPQGEMFGARMRAARGKSFSLLEYDRIARWTKAEDNADLGEKLSDQTDEARVKLEDGSKEDLLCAWRMQGTQVTPYSDKKVSGRLKEVKKESFYLENAMVERVLEKLMRYRVEWEEDSIRN